MASLHAAPISGSAQTLTEIIGHLGQVQADLASVTTFLQEVVATDAQPDKTAQRAQLRGIAARSTAFITKQHEQLGDRLQTVYTLQSQAEVAPYRSDLARIGNLWEEIDAAQLPALLQSAVSDDPAVSVDLARARNLLDQHKRLRREIGVFTIPKRISQITREGFGVGAPMDFHERFQDELDDGNDRLTVLRRLAALDADVVGGMVEVEGGIIYRIGGRGRRWLSYGLILGGALVGGGAVYALSEGIGGLKLDFRGPDDRSLPFGQLWQPYLLLMLGVLAHIVKKASELSLAERSRGGAGGPQVILDRLPLWIHVREYRFLLTVVAAVILFVLIGMTGQLSGSTALFAGYTIDSVSDLVFQRFNAAVSTHAAGVKKLLSAVTP